MEEEVFGDCAEVNVDRHLMSDKVAVEYLNFVMAEDDPALLKSAIMDVIKVRGVTNVSRASGLSRVTLHSAFLQRSHPRFETVLKALNGMGFTIRFAIEKTE